MNLLFTYPETIVDGEGIRYSIYLAGCRHHCRVARIPNPEPIGRYSAHTGKNRKIICEINANPLLDGITFSGGDPLYHPQEFLALVKQIKEATGQNIWCYTGYTFEQIQNDEMLKPVLDYVDVIVDGRFEPDLYSPYLEFRGSSNQRIIRVR